jgi:hypothetical protein
MKPFKEKQRTTPLTPDRTLIEGILDGGHGLLITEQIQIIGNIDVIKQLVMEAARKGYQIGLKKGQRQSS